MAKIIDVTVPDIGTTSPVDVIEILVSPGDEIKQEDSLITLESDKASMEVPSPTAGKVKDIKIKVGDKIKQGDLILTVEAIGSAGETSSKAEATKEKTTEAPKKTDAQVSASPTVAIQSQTQSAATKTAKPVDDSIINAGPGVRRLARELGIQLETIRGSGPKGRILKEDLRAALAGSGVSGGFAMPSAPVVDFAQFGETEIAALSKIKKLTGTFLHRNWITVPHVTQFDEADITELEAFRQSQRDRADKEGVKLTLLVFIMKALVRCLKKFPTFNASLDASGENLILKKYFHIGVAVDTPQGLVVPVIRDVNKKSLFELANELGKISAKAREKGLTPMEMQGGCISISSLGGIGGTSFTPIVNAPEVAILGVSKSAIKPVYENEMFVPRLMLPLSLSYDHRVIDGAEGARFIVYLAEILSDIRRLML